MKIIHIKIDKIAIENNIITGIRCFTYSLVSSLAESSLPDIIFINALIYCGLSSPSIFLSSFIPIDLTLPVI